MPSIALPTALVATAQRQHGTFSREQARSTGLTDRQLRYRLEAGSLLADLGDTFRIAGAPVGPMQRYAAGVLAVPGGALAVDAAAHAHGIPGFGAVQPQVMTVLPAHHDIPGVTVLRRADLLDRHRCVVNGIAATTIPRTVLDLAAGHSWREMIDVVDALTEAKRLSVTVLFDEFDRIARRGRNGTAVMRRILDARLTGLTVDRSELEQRGVRFLRRHRFPMPIAEFRPPWAGPAVGRVDFAWVEQRVVLELDGRRWHDRSDRFEHDRLRDQLAMAHGWIVVRVTWRQLHEDEAGVAERLRLTLRTRSVGVP